MPQHTPAKRAANRARTKASKGKTRSVVIKQNVAKGGRASVNIKKSVKMSSGGRKTSTKRTRK